MKSVSAGPAPACFGQVMEEWLRSIDGRVKPTTFSVYDNIVKRHLCPFFAGDSPDEIDDSTVERFVREKQASGLSPATIKCISAVLRSVLRYGRRYGCLAEEGALRSAPVRAPRDVAVLSDDELRRLVSILGKNPDGRALGVFICVYTGLRVGEICGLRWGDVSPACDSITVRRTVCRVRRENGTELYVGEPKSVSSRRRIPLPLCLREVLARRRGPEDCYVVTNSPDRIPEPRNMQRYLTALLSSAGVRHVNFHALRHTFATRCVELGFDVKALSMILGHANVSVTLNTYVHPSYERMKAMMELLDG